MSVYFQKTYQRSFGTWPLKGLAAQSAVQSAAEVGYRAFDTAQMYANEKDVCEALRATGLPREDLFITTKVMKENFDESRFLPSVEQSLRDLQLSEVDVLLLHWPPANGDIVPGLKQLQRAKDSGLARNIGVSNYTAAMMRLAAQTIEGPIVTNQVEFHPLLNQDKLLDATHETGIPLSSYCSVARGRVLESEVLVEISKIYDKTPAQIALRWILQKGVSINTMSTKPGNIAANFDVMDFTLSSVDMAKIEALTQSNCRIVTKSVVPWAPDFD